MTTSRGRIAVLYAIGVLAAGQLGIVPPLVPALQRDLGLSLTSAGMTVSIVTLVGALFGLAGRRLVREGWSRACVAYRHPRHGRGGSTLCGGRRRQHAARRARPGRRRLPPGRRRLPLADGRRGGAAAPCIRPVAVGYLRAGRHRAFGNRGGGLRRRRGLADHVRRRCRPAGLWPDHRHHRHSPDRVDRNNTGDSCRSERCGPPRRSRSPFSASP